MLPLKLDARGREAVGKFDEAVHGREVRNVVWDDQRLDLLSRRVTRAGQALVLQPKEFALLEYLMRNAGRVVSKTAVLEHVYDYGFDPQTNVVDVLVCRLRAKLDRVRNMMQVFQLILEACYNTLRSISQRPPGVGVGDNNIALLPNPIWFRTLMADAKAAVEARQACMKANGAMMKVMVPVIKGQGYGLGAAVLLDEAARIGAPFAVVIGGTMGSLYLGWVTPTEAAAVGCFAAFVVSAIWGKLGWAELRAAMTSSVMISGNILLIVYTAFVFSYAISVAGVGEQLTAWLVGLKLSRLEFFFALFVLYTVLGCLVESLGMIVITVPLLYPVLLQYHIDPVWFGIILVLFIELGQISPPIGINLFVIQSIWDGRLQDIVFGTIPFHLLMFVLLVMLVFWPEIALWLPAHMGKGP